MTVLLQQRYSSQKTQILWVLLLQSSQPVQKTAGRCSTLVFIHGEEATTEVQRKLAGEVRSGERKTRKHHHHGQEEGEGHVSLKDKEVAPLIIKD